MWGDPVEVKYSKKYFDYLKLAEHSLNMAAVKGNLTEDESKIINSALTTIHALINDAEKLSKEIVSRHQK